MDNRTHFVFFMAYCIQSHRIKYIEFLLQNINVAIRKVKIAFSLLFFKECTYSKYCHLQMSGEE